MVFQYLLTHSKAVKAIIKEMYTQFDPYGGGGGGDGVNLTGYVDSL